MQTVTSILHRTWNRREANQRPDITRNLLVFTAKSKARFNCISVIESVIFGIIQKHFTFVASLPLHSRTPSSAFTPSSIIHTIVLILNSTHPSTLHVENTVLCRLKCIISRRRHRSNRAVHERLNMCLYFRIWLIHQKPISQPLKRLLLKAIHSRILQK